MSEYFGPWRYEESTHSIFDKDDDLIVDANSGDFASDPRRERALLIAAAPELLEACLRMRNQLHAAGYEAEKDSLNPTKCLLAQIETALSKALGSKEVSDDR